MIRKSLFVIVLAFVAFSTRVSAQDGPIMPMSLDQAKIDQIVKKFTANEGAFREALKDYSFNRYATVNTVGMGGQITGTYKRDSELVFTRDGQRFERIIAAPVPTVAPGLVTPEDLEDLGGVTPFALDPYVADQYSFTLVGTQKIDTLNLYVFDITPKVMPDPKKTKQRFFTGRIWVDTDDLLIVKTKGKGIPETKTNKFPVVETWRENIDGKYWFPSYAEADDQLIFDNGSTLHIRLKVLYNRYKLGRTEVIVVGEDNSTPADTTPAPTPTPIKPQN